MGMELVQLLQKKVQAERVIGTWPREYCAEAVPKLGDNAKVFGRQFFLAGISLLIRVMSHRPWKFISPVAPDIHHAIRTVVGFQLNQWIY